MQILLLFMWSTLFFVAPVPVPEKRAPLPVPPPPSRTVVCRLLDNLELKCLYDVKSFVS